MLCCGRSWTKCLAAVIATATLGPLSAAPYMPSQADGAVDSAPKPLIVPAARRGQDRNFSGYARAEATESVIDYGSKSSTESLEHPFNTASGSNGGAVSPAGWAQRPIEQTQHSAPPALGHWVAVVGAVAKPGCYELSTRSISVAELMEKCGGLNSGASGTIAVVRDGRAVGLAYNPQDRLLGGDVIVAAEKPAAPSRVAAAGLREVSGSSGAAGVVQLGLVNVLDRPVPVCVPSSYATVAGVLAVANQTHLRPDQIKVIMGGTDEMFGDQSTELTPGTVLVFPPGSVNPETLREVETRFYPAPAQTEAVEPTPMTAEASLRPLGVAPSTLAVPVGEAPADLASQMPVAELGPSAPTANLSSLPRVEMLDAPQDSSLQFPRTADASGAMPIGAPEASSHIVPFPSDAVESAPQAETATPAPPSAVTLSEDEDAKEGSKSLPTLSEFAPTLLIGTILGAVTFFGLRQWRKRRLFESIASRLTSIPQTIRTVKPARAPEAKAFSPDEMLAALIANRLALREEAVVLAPAMQLYGRSPAMKHRRIDPPAAEIARPHVPLNVPRATEGTRRPSAADANRGPANFRFDTTEDSIPSRKSDAGSTPFERALAAMRSGQK